MYFLSTQISQSPYSFWILNHDLDSVLKFYFILEHFFDTLSADFFPRKFKVGTFLGNGKVYGLFIGAAIVYLTQT